MSKYIFLDFEYCKPAEEYVETVCCSWSLSDKEGVRNKWLYKDEDAKVQLAELFKGLDVFLQSLPLGV